jgi:hypothetical protein
MLDMLDKFGEILIQRVRDKAINDLEMILDGKMKGRVRLRLGI